MSDFQKPSTIDDWSKQLDNNEPMTQEQFNAVRRAASVAQPQRVEKAKTDKCYPPLSIEVQREKNANKWVHYKTDHNGNGREATAYAAEDVYVGNAYVPWILGVLFLYCAVKLLRVRRYLENNYNGRQPDKWVKADSRPCLPPSGGMQITRSDGRAVGNCQPSEFGIRRVG